jgi:hypothetical protein
MALLATALACLAAYPGCGGPPVAEEPQQPAPAASFAFSYERSGGLAAMPERLNIRPARRATLTTRGPNGETRTVRFRAPAKKVEALRHALVAAEFKSIVGPGLDPACADCYAYTMRYEGNEVSFDQTDEPPPLRPVLARVEALIAAH